MYINFELKSIVFILSYILSLLHLCLLMSMVFVYVDLGGCILCGRVCGRWCCILCGRVCGRWCCKHVAWRVVASVDTSTLIIASRMMLMDIYMLFSSLDCTVCMYVWCWRHVCFLSHLLFTLTDCVHGMMTVLRSRIC